MKGKAKKYFIGMLCGIVSMFLWIFLAVALTGGREAEAFTKSDRVIMIIFSVVEIATVIMTFLFAVLFGNEQGKKNRQFAPAAETREKAKARNRGTGLLVLAFAISSGTMIGGILLGKNLSVFMRDLSGWVLGISCVASAVLLLLNAVLQKWYTGRVQKQQVGQIQQFVYSHRERAEETAAQKLRLISYLRRVTAIYAVLLGVFGLCVALCAGIVCETGSAVAFCFVAALLIMCTFSRIRFPVPQDMFEENKTYVTKQQYPQLYAQAEKAAKTMGCNGEIRIALLADCNAGIAKVGRTFSVQIGAILLGALTREEIYSVLLHEFAHQAENNRRTLKESEYLTWLYEGRMPHFYSGITNLFFAFFDTVYKFQHGLYAYASSILIESAADQAMLLCGKPDVAASALIKLWCYQQFSWEKGTQDEICVYEQETPDKQLLTKELQHFLVALTQNGERWKRLLDVEIQSRAASHPTLKLRLEVLGVRDPQIITDTDASDYTREREQALAYVDAQICENLKENYEERRKTFYLDPKAQVEAWENNGKPVVAEEYADIVWALRQLGRNEQAIALCESAIEQLPKAANCNAYFIRGCHRLHSYDAAGIADIYTAIENNSNYLDEGIDTIGTFCCLTGNQEELDVYRQKAVMFVQKYRDQYSKIGTLSKKDRLSTEQLPDGMLDKILNYIHSIEDGQVESIYLVRKTVTADFFTSVFIISFDLNTEDTVRDEILHKIFRYLDTCSDWQFSLFDFRDVMNVPFYKVENCCVYRKEES